MSFKQSTADVESGAQSHRSGESEHLLPRERVFQADIDEKKGGVVLGLPAWLICFTWVAFGVMAACYMEAWGPDTGLYVMLQVITTIGYGDVTVHTQRMKFYTAFYVLATLLLISAYVTELAEHVVKVQTNMVSHKVNQIERARARKLRLAAGDDADSDVDPDEDSDHDYNHDHDVQIASVVVFIVFACAGTVFYGIVEACSCSYGVTAIEGCVEVPLEQCYETGGAVKTWVDAFYMSIITMTTVGFGDHSPKSRMGRAFGCVWMLFGVIATANLMAKFGALLLVRKKKKLVNKLSRPLFQQIDQTKDGSLSRSEFRYYAMIKFGMATKADFDEIDKLFDHIDTDKNSSLTFEEIEKECDPG